MIVSFEDYVPEPRFDGLPWTQVTIEESASGDGPWTLIDTQALNPVDTDPKNPQPRSFTTSLAVVPEGWYRVAFKDAAGDILYTDPVQNLEPTQVDYKPTVGQVARKILSRTRDSYGNLSGNFSATSTPTAEQVIQIIDDVSTEVADLIGDEIPTPLNDDAANVVALRAAMQIETDFYAEQVNSGRSIYPQLEKQFNSALAALQKQIEAFDRGSTEVDATQQSLSPSYSFPSPAGLNGVGWMDRRM